MTRPPAALAVIATAAVLTVFGNPADPGVAATGSGGLGLVNASAPGPGLAEAAAARPARCRTRAQRRKSRCRVEQIGKRGRVLKSPSLGRGGVGDQNLPFDTGLNVLVTQGNNYPVSHNNVYTRWGWDFGVRAGTTVRATMPGTVLTARGGCPPATRSSACNGGWGNTVVVRVADGTCARFGHLSSIAVAQGQAVARYDVIGSSGNSGNSYGAHLHYQRENCTNGYAAPSTFVEAGAPVYPQRVTSANAPESPQVPDTPPPVITVPPVPGPGPAPVVDRVGVESMNFVGQGNYWAYTWWAWDTFVARSNTLTYAGAVMGNPNLPSGQPVAYNMRIRICGSQPDEAGNCSPVLADISPQVVNYGLTAGDIGDVAVQAGRTYWILATAPPKVAGRDWDSFWASTTSGRAPGQRDSIGSTKNLNAVVRGFNR